MGKKYLIFTKTYPKQIIDVIASNSFGGLDYAADNFGKSIIDGLNKNDIEYTNINIPNVGSYPVYSRLFRVPGVDIKNAHSISFVNLTYIKRLFINVKIKRALNRWVEENSDDEKIILFYNFEGINLLRQLKKRNHNTKFVVLVTDIPEYMDATNDWVIKVNRILRKVGSNKFKENLEFADAFVLLSPYMKDKLPVEEKPYIIIEGIYNNTEKKNTLGQETNPNKRLLYSGNLGQRYGIVNLLEAFHRIPDNNYELLICGDGDGLNDVKRYSEKDSRIKYLGLLARNEVLKLQSECTLLVNPRNSADSYTMYSFPSKTMEYLASGTPVMMAHLKSIPTEYDEFIFYVEDETIEGWKNTIMEACSLPQDKLRLLGERAKCFIYEQKTPKEQIKRLIDFLNSL